MTKQFDLIVIGAGPGGYIAAIRAAQLGFKVACIDQWKDTKGKPALGGTCTNVGCIPSKALLQSSEYFEHATQHFSEHGITATKIGINIDTMLSRKDSVIKQNNEGILFLFKKNKIDFFNSTASFVKSNNGLYEIAISDKSEENVLAKHIIIATGSKPRALPHLPFDEEVILSNEGALKIQSTPKRLGVIGAGVIGLEMGSVWRRLGSDVTILEGNSQFLSVIDETISKEAHKMFVKQGLTIQLGVIITDVKKTKKSVTVTYVDGTGTNFNTEFDKLIVSIGRTPNTEHLNTQAIGLQLDERGAIVVNDLCQTNLTNIWAIGDVVRGPMLAHKAEEEGVAVAERLAGQHGHVDFNVIPWVIYTSPEIAWVGRTEQQLKAQGIAYKSGTFPFLANGRARALGDTRGQIKMLADEKTDEILGVHIIGPQASELIAEAAMAMVFKASSEDIARICHAHPSLSESMKEAALAVDKRTLNF